MAELKSNIEWKQWGKDDPLWGVSSWASKQKDGPEPWTEEEFYALGASDWQDFSSHWQQYGVSSENCLEIGCGAGRMTRQLATFFDHVQAVDVSEDMINRARKAMPKDNVVFSVIDGLHLPQCDGCMKAIFTTHVLQHLDNEDIGFAYFREFFRVLQPGGTIMVHLPVYQFPKDAGSFGALLRYEFAAHRALSDFKADIMRRLGVKIMRGTLYSIRSLTAQLAQLGFKNIEFRIFPLKSNGDYHPFVFATK
jgi:SAM-dependent methyltransferase